MKTDFDIAVLGSGFAGSLLAMIARRLGHSVVLIERGTHPRFAIGESSTPMANLLLEELAQRYDLPQMASLAKWGTWQEAHPEIGCGLKRGFTFYHHVHGRAWTDERVRRNQMLVAASPHDGVGDTHWYRPDFDHFLVRQAEELGVEYLDDIRIARARFSDDGCELSLERQGKAFDLRSEFVFDATGPRGCLHRLLNLGEAPLASMPPTQGLYSHLRGVRRWDDLHASREQPPYPVDDAAMHHVFDGGWIWVLRFNNGITSAGVAATDQLANELRFAEGEPAWGRLLERLPSVNEQFAETKPCLPFVHASRLSFRSAAAVGQRWALLPSAAGFVDPLLSTGFPLTLLGVERLAQILTESWGSPRMAEQLSGYEQQTFGELDTVAALVGALYANMDDSEMFDALALLYFAAAMHAETARRLGQFKKLRSRRGNEADLTRSYPPPPPHVGGYSLPAIPSGSLEASFLLQDHPKFGPAMRTCVSKARRRWSATERKMLRAEILEVIEPINLAGLGDPGRRNWYPCRAEDLLAAAPKLGVDRPAIETLLRKCGFNDGPRAESRTRAVRKPALLRRPRPSDSLRA
jgi:FADH2 O2-dependent halogenase